MEGKATFFGTPKYMQWTILTLLYQTLWKISLVLKRLIINAPNT